jgi:hypothetical protein
MVRNRRFPVAVRLLGKNFRQSGPAREFLLPGGDGRAQAPPVGRGWPAGDCRSRTEMKSPPASRKAEKQAIGCPLRMPTRLKDLI